jgi:hypothetical protein
MTYPSKIEGWPGFTLQDDVVDLESFFTILKGLKGLKGSYGPTTSSRLSACGYHAGPGCRMALPPIWSQTLQPLKIRKKLFGFNGASLEGCTLQLKGSKSGFGDFGVVSIVRREVFYPVIQP